MTSNQHEQRREQLANEWRAAGAGVGRLPHLIPIVHIATMPLDGGREIFEWGTRAAAGIHRDIDHHLVDHKGLDHIFPPKPRSRTQIMVCKPAPLGTGDVGTNKNLTVVVPPQRDQATGIDSPLYLIEFGCPHPTWTMSHISPTCERYTCDVADCGYSYDVDHGD